MPARVRHQICSGNPSPSHVSSHLARPPPPLPARRRAQRAGPAGPGAGSRAGSGEGAAGPLPWKGAEAGGAGGRREPIPEAPRSCCCPRPLPAGYLLFLRGSAPCREEEGSRASPQRVPLFSFPHVTRGWSSVAWSSSGRSEELCSRRPRRAQHSAAPLVRPARWHPAVAGAAWSRARPHRHRGLFDQPWPSNTPCRGPQPVKLLHFPLPVGCGNCCKAAHTKKNRQKFLAGPRYPSTEHSSFTLGFHYRNLNRQKLVNSHPADV